MVSNRPFAWPARILANSAPPSVAEPMARSSNGLRISSMPSSRQSDIIRPSTSLSTFQTSSKYASGTVPTISPSKSPFAPRIGSVAVISHSPFERALIGVPHSSVDPGCSRWRMK